MGHVLDLEGAGDERPVAEQPTGEALLQLEALDRAKPHRRRPPAQRAVDHADLFRRHHEPRALQSHTARRQTAAATTTSAAPRTASGDHGIASSTAPAPASSAACASGRASETPWRRASKQTSSSLASTARPGSPNTASLLRLQPVEHGENRPAVTETARKAFVATVVAVAVIALALALWQLKIVIALVFLGFIVAAAMRPSVDRLAEHRIPRPLGVALHYLALVAAVGLLLWLVVPRATDQVNEAIGGVPTSQQELNEKAKHS